VIDPNGIEAAKLGTDLVLPIGYLEISVKALTLNIRIDTWLPSLFPNLFRHSFWNVKHFWMDRSS
jgi:hypothetical protein